MSAEIVITNNTAAKVKKITLAGKYTKFMVFGYWFIQRLNADETVAAAARDTLLMFASPEEQNLMFDSFFNDLKTSTTEMKALVKQHNKPPAKPKKEKNVKDQSEKTTKPKPKGKKTTDLHTDPQDALVAEIVAAAQTEIAHGDILKTVLRKGEPTVPPNPLPPVEDVVAAVAAIAEQPVKKKVVKKVAKAAEKPAEIEEVVAEEPVKKTDKADKEAEKLLKEAAKAAEKKAKEDAKEAEKQAKEAAKAAEKQAKEAAKAAEKLLKEQAKPAKKEKSVKKAKEVDTKPAEPELTSDEEEGRGSRGTDGSPDEDDTLNLRPISFPDGKSFLLDESTNDLYDPSCVDNDDFSPVATYRGNQWFPHTPSLNED